MSLATLYRASGLALIIGAVLGPIGNILWYALYSGSDPHQYLTVLWVIVTLVSFIGIWLLLLGLPAILARMGSRAGWLGFIGFILTFTGNFLYVGYSVVYLLDLPWLAQVAPNLVAGNEPPTYFPFFLVAAIVYALGGLLLGIAVMRSGVLSRWAGLLLLIGAVLNLAVEFPMSGIMIAIVSNVSFVIYSAGLVWIGYTLMSAKSMQEVPAATPSFAIGD